MLCDADGLAGKDRPEVDLFVPQTNAAAIGHDNGFVVKRIVDPSPTGVASESCLSDKEVSDDIWLVSFISFCPMSSSTFPWLCGHPANAHRRNQSLPNQEG